MKCQVVQHYVLTKNIVRNEFSSLGGTLFIPRGTVVYMSSDIYGCCRENTYAMSVNPSGIPYFEVPHDAVAILIGADATKEIMANNKLILTIAHNIYLTREQRYELHEIGVCLQTEGVSVPVWIKDGRSNEPAEEVFCRYRLCHTAEKAEDKSIKFLNDGYEILLSSNMQKNLLDLKDEGSCCLIFANHGKVRVNDKLTVPVIHYVSIQDYDVLIKTL